MDRIIQLFINNLLLVDARLGIYEIEFAPMISKIFFMSKAVFHENFMTSKNDLTYVSSFLSNLVLLQYLAYDKRKT